MTRELEGLKIARAVRVSTQVQKDNYSALEQDKYFDEKLVTMGAEIVPFDEQATSGRDLSKRAVLRSILTMIDDGKVNGIAYYDVKRLTRNELGTDGGIIARHLIDARAIFVSNDRVYRLWQESDLIAFQFDCLLSGLDIRNIRRTLWRGIMAKADTEPFFMGKHPLGYSTRIEEERRGSKTIIRRVPIKDPSAAPMMSALTEAFEQSMTIGEVVKRMNASPYRPTKKVTGEQWDWRTFTVRYILNNPWYVGRGKFGRTAKKTSSGHMRSPVWEDHKEKRLDFGGPEATAYLAYWTPTQVNRWKDKFGYKPVVQMRSRTYVRPLVGILRCVTCDRPMISGGPQGYNCRAHQMGTCPKPQFIRQNTALSDLFKILPEIWVETKVLLSEAKATRQSDTRASDIESEISILKEQQELDTAEWLKMKVKPAFLSQALQDREQEILRLQTKLEEARSVATNFDELAALDELMTQDPTHLFSAVFSEEQQARIYRLLLEKVVIECRGRSHHVVDSITFTPRLGSKAGQSRTIVFTDRSKSNQLVDATAPSSSANRHDIDYVLTGLGMIWREVA